MPGGSACARTACRERFTGFWVVCQAGRSTIRTRTRRDYHLTYNTRGNLLDLYSTSVIQDLESADAAAVATSGEKSASLWDHELQTHAGTIIGLVLARHKHFHHPSNMMQVLSREERILADFWTSSRGATDMNFISLEESFPIRGRVFAWSASNGTNIKRTFFDISYDCKTNVLSAELETGEKVSDLFAKRGWDFPTLAIRIPAPFAILCGHGHWKVYGWPSPNPNHVSKGWVRMMNLSRVRNLMPNWSTSTSTHHDCDAEVDVSEDKLPDKPLNIKDLDPHRFQDIADMLRKFAAASSDSMAPDEQQTLHGYIKWLQSLVKNLAMTSTTTMEKVGKRWAYCMDIVVQSVMLAERVKNPGHMLEVIETSIRLSLPEVLANFYIERLRSTANRPKKTSVNRHRLTFHMAWCLTVRELNREIIEGCSFAAYQTTDSSALTRGGRDWQLSAMLLISEDNLEQAFEDAQLLWVAEDMNNAEVVLSMSRLRSLLKLRTLPPVCMGPCHTGLYNKMHTWLWQHRVQNTWPGVAKVFSNTVGACTDFGVESLLITHRPFNLREYFPWIPIGGDGAHGHDGSLFINIIFISYLIRFLIFREGER